MRISGTNGGVTRRQLLGTAGAVAGGGLAGCLGGLGGGTSSQSQQGNTVTFLNDRSTRKIWEAAAEEFNAGSKYSVEITWLPKGTSTNEQVAKMKAAGNLPALIFESSADCYSQTLNGQTEPLTDVVDDLGVKDTVRVDGESYLVPAVAAPLMMIYRTDIIDGNPRTRKEWQSEAKRIQKQGQAAYAVGAGRTNAAATHMNQSLWNGGVDPYNGTGTNIEITLDQGDTRKRAVRTFNWLQQMNKVGPQASGWAWSDFTNALIQGSLVGWAGLAGLAIQNIKANRPDLLSKFTVAPYPIASSQKPTQWWSYFEGMYSYKNAANVKGGKEFIKFFMKSDYYYKYLRRTAPFSFPTSLQGVKSNRYSKAKIYDTFPKFLEIVKNNWEMMAPVLNTGDNGAPNAVAADAYGQQLYGQAADQLLYGGLSPGETVDWLANELRKLTKK
jgi:multiple sugar transport system substrate-binding protein